MHTFPHIDHRLKTDSQPFPEPVMWNTDGIIYGLRSSVIWRSVDDVQIYNTKIANFDWQRIWNFTALILPYRETVGLRDSFSKVTNVYKTVCLFSSLHLKCKKIIAMNVRCNAVYFIMNYNDTTSVAYKINSVTADIHCYYFLTF